MCLRLLQAGEARRQLRLVVTSATLETESMLRFFKQSISDVPLLRLPGRCHPVEIAYHPVSSVTDIVSKAVQIASHVHRHAPSDENCLIFLPSESDIRACQKQLEIALDRMMARAADDRGTTSQISSMADAVVLTLYGAMSGPDQQKCWSRVAENTRKFVIATNIAETAITIPGVAHVIDSGLCKVRHHRNGVDRLCLEQISRSSAQQRAGRAGRTGPGTCYRLYSAEEFDQMPSHSVPELQRSDLSTVALLLASIGLNALHVALPSPPLPQTWLSAFQVLSTLQALRVSPTCHTVEITALGRCMAELPLSPRLAKFLIASAVLGCLSDALACCAIISIEHLFHGISSRGDEHKDALHKVASVLGDLHSYVAVFRLAQMGKLQGDLEQLVSKTQWRDCEAIHQQLDEVFREGSLNKLQMQSSQRPLPRTRSRSPRKRSRSRERRSRTPDQSQQVASSLQREFELCTGLTPLSTAFVVAHHDQCAELDDRQRYRVLPSSTITDQESTLSSASIDLHGRLQESNVLHPSSVLTRVSPLPRAVVFGERAMASRGLLRHCCTLDDSKIPKKLQQRFATRLSLPEHIIQEQLRQEEAQREEQAQRFVVTEPSGLSADKRALLDKMELHKTASSQSSADAARQRYLQRKQQK